MKKIFVLIIAALALTQSVRAELVTPERAAQSARNLLGMKKAPVLENGSSSRAPGINGQESVPEYYVFNNPDGGWAIIAADDRVNPILAYSHDGSFNSADMPENLEWWMDGVAQFIVAVRGSDIVASDKVKKAWAVLTLGAPESEKKELETAKWNQSKPYNDLCPIVNGENQRSVTGCVATAMSIIMQYNSWPAHGKGVIGGYVAPSTDTYIPSYSIDNHYYDWDLMSDENAIAGNPQKMTLDQRYQIATLVHDCGVAVEMDYSSEGSGTQTEKAVPVFKEVMSYAESVSFLSRSNYSLDQWFSIIKNEIDHDRLVLYSGNGNAGGHAFVCDGYDTEGSMVHINWGWGNGDINAFYTLALELPQAYGFNFSDYQEAIVGIAPDTADVIINEKPGLTCVKYNGFYGIEPYVPVDMRSGSEVMFYLGWFKNNEDRDVKHEFKVCLMDKDGNVRQEGWHSSIDFPASNGYFYANETDTDILTVDPELSDYFQVFVKNDDEAWVPMSGNYDILPDEEGLKCGVLQDPLIILPEDCAPGVETELSLSLGYSRVTSVKWSVNGTELEGNKATFVQGKNEIRAEVEYMDESTGFISRTISLE